MTSIKKGKKTSRTEENVERIEEYFEKEPKTSISRTSLGLDLSYSSVNITRRKVARLQAPNSPINCQTEIKKPVLSLQNPD